MFLLVFLGLVGICYSQEQYINHAEQGNVTFTTTPDNRFIKLSSMQNGYPSGIEYLTPISSESGLMVRMVFGKDDDLVDYQNPNDTMNICDVLAKAIDEPNSPQALFNLAESLGLATSRCPIEKGIKVLDRYEFPTEFATNDLGCGARYYEMIVETANPSPDSGAVIMKMHVDLDLTKMNETCTENSSSTMIVPSVITSLAIALFASRLNN